MKIGYLNNNLPIQQKQLKDAVKKSEKDTSKAHTDSNEISSGRNNSFEDNRVNVAKSAVLYDVSVKESDRIAELKAAIADGSYHVSSEDLADALLS
ncbi:flagellar biosynthesis anti-sigma factor FlgM [Eubacteriaceae bacterium ES3]|nr:flagellar biosynthesis anti-sigma factor FlgM [Eubacteriaceae bacterium ES3]